MKFHSLSVTNLRAIRRFEIDDLGSFVVIAGQNGCGKSCVFDAIRLLKSLYGGYSANEYHQWFGEFAINLQDPRALARLFRDASAPIEIAASLSFTDSEVQYIMDNAESLVQPIAWQQVTGQPVDFYTFSRVGFATQWRQYQAALAEAIPRLAADVRGALQVRVQRIALYVTTSGEIRIERCTPAEVAFQAYAPEHLGVIEYHSASRSYARQDVGGITLDTRAFEDQRRQQRLYNWQNKYQNVKTELASSYLRRIIAKEAGRSEPGDDLNETLQELFQTFFPDKTYEGVRPQPRGSLEFPVRLSTGEVHDIDELSSGEKEILYGYLKLKNSTPAGSIVLLDEPELHLNPSLLQGFADFYYRHLGVSQGNQLWLVTHSDTLLRQSVGNINYRVFQMLPATAAEPGTNQAVPVLADDDVERVTIELVGDLASYRPHGKVVILEGQTEGGFDVNVVKRLFPDFARRVNLVSGGNKPRVRDLYEALEASAVEAGIKNRFYAIVDRDAPSANARPLSGSEFMWDVYHIENYLLDAPSIRAALETLGNRSLASDEDVTSELRRCATASIDELVLHHLEHHAYGRLIAEIRVGGPPDTTSPAEDVHPSVTGSLQRLSDVGATLTVDHLKLVASSYRESLELALRDGTWMREFPGRLVIRRFAHKVLKGKIDPLLFTNAVLDKMVEHGVRPKGMTAVLDEILART